MYDLDFPRPLGYDDPADYAPPASYGDAHAEWHRNSGNPIGQTSCPWDTCDPHADDEALTEAELRLLAAIDAAREQDDEDDDIPF